MSGVIVGLLLKVCVLVTLTFLLTRTRLFGNLIRPRLSGRDQATALLIFLVMAFTEEYITPVGTLMNARIIAVCAAGLLAGPWIGGIVGIVVTALSCYHHGFPPFPIGASMFVGGLLGGFAHRWSPHVALRPASGLALGIVTSLLRYGLALGYGTLFGVYGSAQSPLLELAAAVIQGTGVALILLIVEQTRSHEAQSRAAAMAEVRALQARMDPHFLFNALNTLSALSTLDAKSVPKATARLGLFLRASLNQHDRPFVCLQEEMDVVSAYLDIERLRHGDRLDVTQSLDPSLRSAAVPPFLLQPLIENAVRHGIEPRNEGGRIDIVAGTEAERLVLTVSDTGMGIPPNLRERLFRSSGPHVHALALLRRRLHGLYGRDFAINIQSRQGEGTSVTIRIPFRPIDSDGMERSPIAPSEQDTVRERREADACTELLLR